MAVGEAPQQLEEEEPHVPRAQPAGVLLEVLRQVRVLKRVWNVISSRFGMIFNIP